MGNLWGWRWSNNAAKILKPQKIIKNSNMANMKYLKYGKTIISSWNGLKIRNL